MPARAGGRKRKSSRKSREVADAELVPPPVEEPPAVANPAASSTPPASPAGLPSKGAEPLQVCDLSGDVLQPKDPAAYMADLNAEIREAYARYRDEQKERLGSVFRALEARAGAMRWRTLGADGGLVRVSHGQGSLPNGQLSCAGCSLAAASAFPVSYTHLTLPTNREV